VFIFVWTLDTWKEEEEEEEEGIAIDSPLSLTLDTWQAEIFKRILYSEDLHTLEQHISNTLATH
jgi:hypothetical protein